ncbi:YjgB family protein [Planococcus liqunii]|uniref:YjgB family protein n=1 Tax=Planococcus liqunii TaxID=3058394 RepID=UPI002637A93F|nr:YjgB family protein [Planococcus sp. N056]WKA50424.1 YjgB family protein [Planococcus sp. N056]
MVKKLFWLGSAATLALSLAACSEASSNEDVPKSHTEEHSTETVEETAAAEPEQEKAEESESGVEEPVVDDEQKGMAIDTLKEIVKNAETGIVYRFSDGFQVGKATRDEVYAAIGEPEEQVDEFDFYHGSMGNASYQIAYDKNNVMEEARYFGTNVERQTNLGGITKKDLLEHVGEPAEERKIPATGETNLVYHAGDYELQFVLAKNGTTDHVNLLKKQ